ncbi:MAG: sugar porter family MFS transporter [Phycisphaerae bacterium]|nr:sugar porter family MFS transporter [Phycisphaerae bacterium]
MRSSLVAALGGLLFGFDTAVISGAEVALRKVYDLNNFWYGFTVASALIGTILGSITVGRPSDWFGRKKTLIVMAVFYFISAIGSACAWDWHSFLAFRFLGGIGIGGTTVVSPTYIAEISPARLRGRLVAITQFNIVFGILLAFLSNYIITRMHLGDVDWRWMFGVEAFPAAAFFFLLFANPESPRWLVARKKTDDARAVLTRLGEDRNTVEEELAAIQASLDVEHHSLQEPFFCRKYSRPIMLAVLIAVFNQLSGINAILYYAPSIFRMAGAGEESAMLQSVVIGFTNLVFTMAALAIIDHFGRKRLMLVGSVGYIISLAAASVAFFIYGENFTPAGGKAVLLALIVFIASHAFGQGAVIWVFISEIFPNRVRARGQALGSFTHWVLAAAVSWTFKPIAGGLGGGPVFAVYAIMMVLQLLWVIWYMPETKGVPLEEIQRELGIE